MIIQDISDVILQRVHWQASQEHFLGLGVGYRVVVLSWNGSFGLNLPSIYRQDRQEEKGEERKREEG